MQQPFCSKPPWAARTCPNQSPWKTPTTTEPCNIQKVTSVDPLKTWVDHLSNPKRIDFRRFFSKAAEQKDRAARGPRLPQLWKMRSYIQLHVLLFFLLVWTCLNLEMHLEAFGASTFALPWCGRRRFDVSFLAVGARVKDMKGQRKSPKLNHV